MHKLLPIRVLESGIPPHIQQKDQMSCGPTCLRMIAAHFGVEISDDFADEITEKSNSGISLSSLANAAAKIGLNCKGYSGDTEFLKTQKDPFLLHWRANHFVVCKVSKYGGFIVSDPSIHCALRMSEAEIRDSWHATDQGKGEGIVLVFSKMENAEDIVPKMEASKPFSRLVEMAKPYTRQIIVTLLLVLVGVILSLSVPILTRQLFRVGFNPDSQSSLINVLLLQLGAIFCRSLVDFFRTIKSANIAERVGHQVLFNYFASFFGLPLAKMETKNTIDFLGRITDQRRLRSFISLHALSAIFDFLLIFLFSLVVYLFVADVFVAYVIGTGLGVVTFALAMPHILRTNYARVNAVTEARSIEYEMVEGFKDIRLTGSTKDVLNKWVQRHAKLDRLSAKVFAVEAIQRNSSVAIFGLMGAIVNYQLLTLILSGKIEFGDFIAVNIAVVFATQSFLNVVNFFQQGEQAWQSFYRLTDTKGDQFASTFEEDFDGELLPSLSLKVENMSFRYPGSRTTSVLEDINLEIPAGSTLAIVGESGSGKSTLLKLLLGLYVPVKGDIYFGDVPIKESAAAKLNDRSGAVFQDGFLFSDTVRNNISMRFDQSACNEERLDFAIDIADLSNFIESLPLGLNTQVGKEGLSPSGGQTQRILLARAVYNMSDLLVLDEATSSLDTISERKIVENIDKRMPSITKIVVAHRLSTVVSAEQIAVLSAGKIVELGKHHELVKLKGRYFELVKDQLQLSK